MFCLLILYLITLFSSFFAGFLLFSPKGSVTGMRPLGWEFLLLSSVLPLRMHLLSAYYYYDYVVIDVLSNSTLLLDLIVVFAELQEQVPFRMTVGNLGLVYAYFPKHLFVGTAGIK